LHHFTFILFYLFVCLFVCFLFFSSFFVWNGNCQLFAQCFQTDFLTGRSYTYRQLKEYTFRVASALHKHGYKKGDVIATCTINLPEFTILVMAAAALGIIVSPANPAYTGRKFDMVQCNL
jgi:acyl-coenzyme A synthetase/AMP-(fatty) acid ligase